MSKKEYDQFENYRNCAIRYEKQVSYLEKEIDKLITYLVLSQMKNPAIDADVEFSIKYLSNIMKEKEHICTI